MKFISSLVGLIKYVSAEVDVASNWCVTYSQACYRIQTPWVKRTGRVSMDQ